MLAESLGKGTRKPSTKKRKPMPPKITISIARLATWDRVCALRRFFRISRGQTLARVPMRAKAATTKAKPHWKPTTKAKETRSVRLRNLPGNRRPPPTRTCKARRSMQPIRQAADRTTNQSGQPNLLKARAPRFPAPLGKHTNLKACQKAHRIQELKGLRTRSAGAS